MYGIVLLGLVQHMYVLVAIATPTSTFLALDLIGGALGIGPLSSSL